MQRQRLHRGSLLYSPVGFASTPHKSTRSAVNCIRRRTSHFTDELSHRRSLLRKALWVWPLLAPCRPRLRRARRACWALLSETPFPFRACSCVGDERARWESRRRSSPLLQCSGRSPAARWARTSTAARSATRWPWCARTCAWASPRAARASSGGPRGSASPPRPTASLRATSASAPARVSPKGYVLSPRVAEFRRRWNRLYNDKTSFLCFLFRRHHARKIDN